MVMNMLCRVLSEDTPGVKQAPWTQNGSVPDMIPTRMRHSGHATSDELLQLRATVEELSAALDHRSREAYEHGFRAGETAATEKLEGEVRVALETLAKNASEVAAARAEVLHRAEADTVRLSIEIARRVLHREMSVDPSALAALIRAALAKLENQEIYRVKVHPDHGQLVRTCLENAGRGSAVEVIDDPAQARGGASFEISRGTLDASVNTQLREIENGLIDEMRIRS